MIEKILVPTDGSEHAKKAIQYASDLAQKYDAKICLMHVVQEPKVPEELKEFVKGENIHESPSYVYLERLGSKILGTAEEDLRAKGIKEVQSVVARGDPAEKIIEFVERNRIDMIVMGSRGLGGVKGLFLGSVSSKVCHVVNCTCVTVK